MREILFRGKRTDNGEWVYGLLARHNTSAGTSLIVANDITMIPVRAETVGQYTGVTDKNGKKIFEGDIITCSREICGNQIDKVMEMGFVEMKHGAFGLHRRFTRVDGTVIDGYYRAFKDWLEDYDYEVLGNIHDNPELIGGDDYG